MRDYFTIAEYRAYVGERAGGKFSEDQIADAQAEVIDSLEAWAHSAWPNVTARGTGTMTAADPTLTLGTGAFIPVVDVGQAIRVVGAGTDGADLVTTVASVTDTTHAELADAAATTLLTAGDVFLDGDGTAASPRSRTQEFEGGVGLLFTSDIPILSVPTFQFITDTVTSDLAATDYGLYEAGGTIRLDNLVAKSSGFYQITYSYGFTSCPRVIKRPAMAATRSLLHDDLGSGKVPPNTAQLTTEATTFVFAQPGTAFSSPWPWDAEASESVRSYWGRMRPRRAGAA